MSELSITRLTTSDADFDRKLNALLAWESVSDKSVNKIVDDILLDVKTVVMRLLLSTQTDSIILLLRVWPS